jgi:hypothetical protein
MKEFFYNVVIMQQDLKEGINQVKFKRRKFYCDHMVQNMDCIYCRLYCCHETHTHNPNTTVGFSQDKVAAKKHAGDEYFPRLLITAIVHTTHTKDNRHQLLSTTFKTLNLP